MQEKIMKNRLLFWSLIAFLFSYLFIGVILLFIFPDKQANNYLKELLANFPQSTLSLVGHFLARFFEILLWPIYLLT
ncbi:MAG: hypothetical protein ABIH38_00965 [Patescibacteria group bacterium]